MKKILAMVLAMMLVLGMSAVAFADTVEEGGIHQHSAQATYSAIIKAYNITGGTAYPQETLTFVSTPASGNPDTTNLTIAPLQVTGATGTLNITVPEYTKPGIYTYTISEVNYRTTTDEDAQEPVQAVEYTGDTIAVSVLVEYDYTNEATTKYHLKSTVYLTTPDASEKNEDGSLKENEDGKVETFTNTYKLGNLSITKNVTGNLADESKYFGIDVVLSSDEIVASDISINTSEVSSTSNAVTIIAGAQLNDTDTDNDLGDWSYSNGTYTYSTTVYLKHGETITFSSLPEGVTYTVTEQSVHTTGEKNGAEGYTATYSATNHGTANTIDENKTDNVTILNTKSDSVATGISLDNLPYVIIMGLVVLAGAAMLMKKRAYND